MQVKGPRRLYNFYIPVGVTVSGNLSLINVVLKQLTTNRDSLHSKVKGKNNKAFEEPKTKKPWAVL